MGIPTIMVIDPQDGSISQLLEGDLKSFAGGLQQIPGSPCTIDWERIRELLD